MKIVFFGTPQEVVPILENAIKNFEVVAVVSTPDQKSGRKQLLVSSPVKIFAQTQNIPILTPSQFDNKIIEQLQSYKPDLFIVAAYGRILPKEVLALPQYGAINIHPSLLPKYRGPTPIQTALLNGDETSGVTFIKMDEHLDHGPILHQIPFTLETTDTFGWLLKSMFTQSAYILPYIIEEYTSGKLKAYSQDESKATYTKRITKEDGYIDLAILEKLKPSENKNWKMKIARKIRAYYPWPTIWTKTTVNNREMRIKFLPNQMLQVEGKNPIHVKDFLNGYPTLKGVITKLLL